MIHPDALRLAALYGALFLALGVQLTAMPLWLAHRGLSPEAIGLVLGAGAVARMLANPLLTRLGDGPLGVAGLLRRVLGGAALLALALAAAPHPWLVGVLQVALAFVLAPAVSLADLLALDAGRRHPALAYGRLRAAGSVAFVAGTFAGGGAVAGFGPEPVAWLLAAFLALAALIAAAAPAGGRAREAGGGSRLPGLALVAIGAAALAQGSHAAFYAFGSIAWTASGISPAFIGVLWSVAVAAEVALLWAVPVEGRSLRFAAGLLALGSAAAAVRWLALAASPPLAVLLPLQALHGLTFGATQLGAVAALQHLSPPGARAGAMGLLAGAYAAATGLFTFVSGQLYEGTGAAAFAAMAVPALAALALTSALARR